MSRPKYWWYGFVRAGIMRSGKDDNTLQSYILEKAIQDATKETLTYPNGEERMKAVKAVLIDKTRTVEGVALDLYYSENTVKYWINGYVKLVGKKAGY